MKKLSEYCKKRDFSKTKEPISNRKSKKLIYVIHEHHARRLHWDLRLEHNGVLASWAVPKGPSDTEKRLAVRTEDHSLEYAKFHGVISEGYGKGTVKIWDKGTFIPVKFTEKEIIADIKGRKLKGKYVLIKTNFGKKNTWLFFRKKQ